VVSVDVTIQGLAQETLTLRSWKKLVLVLNCCIFCFYDPKQCMIKKHFILFIDHNEFSISSCYSFKILNDTNLKSQSSFFTFSCQLQYGLLTKCAWKSSLQKIDFFMYRKEETVKKRFSFEFDPLKLISGQFLYNICFWSKGCLQISLLYSFRFNILRYLSLLCFFSAKY